MVILKGDKGNKKLLKNLDNESNQALPPPAKQEDFFWVWESRW